MYETLDNEHHKNFCTGICIVWDSDNHKFADGADGQLLHRRGTICSHHQQGQLRTMSNHIDNKSRYTESDNKDQSDLPDDLNQILEDISREESLDNKGVKK